MMMATMMMATMARTTATTARYVSTRSEARHAPATADRAGDPAWHLCHRFPLAGCSPGRAPGSLLWAAARLLICDIFRGRSGVPLVAVATARLPDVRQELASGAAFGHPRLGSWRLDRRKSDIATSDCLLYQNNNQPASFAGAHRLSCRHLGWRGGGLGVSEPPLGRGVLSGRPRRLASLPPRSATRGVTWTSPSWPRFSWITSCPMRPESGRLG